MAMPTSAVGAAAAMVSNKVFTTVNRASSGSLLFMLPELSMMNMMDGEAGLLPVTTWTFSEQTGTTGSSQMTSFGTLMVAVAKLPGHLAKTKLQIRALSAGKAAAQKAVAIASLNVK